MRRFALPFLALLPVPPAAAAEPEQAAGAASTAEALMQAYQARTRVVIPCDRSSGGIVVCGSRAERNARERLPLPRESEDGDATAHRGEAQRASAAPVKQGSCGVVGGQGVGCVGGVPILGAVSMIGKLVTILADPDADIAPPPPLPDRFKGVGAR